MTCLGDETTGDSDGDGVCNDIDVCDGNDASGDSDGDGLCDDIDPVQPDTWTSIAVPSTILDISSYTAIDMEPDGDIDIISRHHNPRNHTWWVNDGSGSFSELTLQSSEGKPFWSDFFDIDGDNDIDFVYGGEKGAILAWFENTGRAFGSENVITSGNKHNHVLAISINSDSLLDLVSYDATAGELNFYLNTGQGFSNKTTIASFLDTNFAGPGLASLDIDNDSDLDLIVSSAQNGGLSWYEKDGAAFIANHGISAISLGGLLKTADIDADGFQDILGLYSGNPVWYRNNGNGTFAALETIASGSFSNYFPADIDSDGDLDIVATSGAQNEVVWIEFGNNGWGLPNRIFTSTTLGNAVSAGDFDNDGDVDIVISDQNNLTLLYNPRLF